jgi:hypothetical protein
VEKARPGSIILVHDIHASTLNALEEIVTGLQARGFKLVTVSELLMLAKKEAEAPAVPAEPVQPAVPEQETAPVAAPAQPQQVVQPAAAPEADMPAASDEAPALKLEDFMIP